jgi:hypothetical protein
VKVEDLFVLTLAGPAALAFYEASPGTPLDLSFNHTGAKVRLPEQANRSPLIINVLWRPFMRGFIDGRPVSLEKDALNRVKISGVNGQVVILRYAPPVGQGLLLGLAAVLLLAAGLFIFQKKFPQPA